MFGPLGWLFGYTLGSMAAAFVVVRIFDNLIHSASDAARGTVFISTWAAVTGRSGMNSVGKTAKRFRLRNTAVTKKLTSLTKASDKGISE